MTSIAPTSNVNTNPDWCGSDGTEFVPSRGFGVDWSGACREHDECYGTPGSSKDLCDYNLQQDMSLACAAQGGGLLCHITAGIYYLAVQLAGHSAFERAQAEAEPSVGPAPTKP